MYKLLFEPPSGGFLMGIHLIFPDGLKWAYYDEQAMSDRTTEVKYQNCTY